MKKLYILLIIALIGFVGNAQIVNIPDVNFKAKLLSANQFNQVASTNALASNGSVITYSKIDTNNDGQIQVNEASAITWLNVSNSAIADLTGIQSCTNLQVLNCSTNQLPSLNVSGLTNLRFLECYSNQLQSLTVSGLTNLQYLNCSINQLTSLNVSGLTNLQSLNCSLNQLTSLNVSGFTNLEALACQSNQLLSLNLNGLTNLLNLDCSTNQLNTLFLKNGSIELFLEFSNNPNLEYVCADGNQFNQIQSKITQYGYTNCHYNSYCSFTPGGTFYTIQGNNRYDNDNNGCDVNDLIYPNLKLTFTDGTNTGDLISDTTGAYRFDTQAGTQTVTPTLENPGYFTISPTTATVTFPTAPSPFTQNFCITANGVHNDLEVSIIPLVNARPGFEADYQIIYKNKGTSIQSGTIGLSYNSAIATYISAIPAVTSQATNSLNWSFSGLQPFETRIIDVVLLLNTPTATPPLNGGDILNYTATISGLTEETPTDNEAILAQTVVNSFDPNDKTCAEGTTVSPDMVGKYVHYVIRFENTGTANAQNIVVKDIIDTTKFNINTLVPLNASAAFTTKISNTNQVEFIFQNINLPFDDANNDGYVAFKIKTKPTLVVGDTFSNSASIYFDYNFPIVTDTFTTTIQTLRTQDFDFGNYFCVYPIPVKSILNLETKDSINVKTINIYDMLGQIVLAVPNAERISRIDVSDLRTGTYFVKVNTDRGTANRKFLKE